MTVLRLITAIALILGFSVASFPAAAQQTETVYRIGFLTTGSVGGFTARLAAFRQGLRELGYSEEKNILIEERFAKGRLERLPALASELVGLGVDVIVTHGGRPASVADRTARAMGKPTPIVFPVSANPLVTKVVASLARPGGNVTGLSDTHADLVAKRLNYLKDVVPSASRVAVLMDSRSPSQVPQLEELRAAAYRLGMTVVPVEFSRPDALDRAFSVLRRERPDALMHFGYALIATYRKQVVTFALEDRLPTMFTIARSVELGGLRSYGTTLLDLYRRTATFVDRILKGAKPADMPVEQPTRFYLTLNLKTAKALGITFPRSLLLRADQVIE